MWLWNQFDILLVSFVPVCFWLMGVAFSKYGFILQCWKVSTWLKVKIIKRYEQRSIASMTAFFSIQESISSLPWRCFWFFKVSFGFILPLFLICVHVCIPSCFFWPCISGGHPCSFFYSSITFHCVWVPEFSNQSNTDGHLSCSQYWLLQIMLQSVCHFAILVVRFGVDFWNCDCWVKGKRHVQCC